MNGPLFTNKEKTLSLKQNMNMGMECIELAQDKDR
jgi:hypothetical protein